MEIIVSVFSAAVALSCLIAIVMSDLRDSKRDAGQIREAGLSGS
jgi:hypothetical protein